MHDEGVFSLTGRWKVGTGGISEWVWAGWITTFLLSLVFSLSILSVTKEGYSDTEGAMCHEEGEKRDSLGSVTVRRLIYGGWEVSTF